MSRALVILASLVIILAGIKVAAPLVVPFLLALFLAIILSPPFFRLQKMGIPGPVALAVIILALGVIGFLTVTILQSSINLFIENLPVYQEKLSQQVSALTSWLAERGLQDPASIFAQYLNPQLAMSYAGTIARALTGTLGQMLLIFIITAFMLFEAAHFEKKVRAVAGESNPQVDELTRSVRAVRRYVSLKTMMSILTGLLVSLWLWLLAFFLNYVPNIGSFVAAVPGVLLGLISLGPAMGIVTALGYVAINIGVSNVIEPRFIGKDLGISPLIILLSLVFWGWLLGPAGMLLSVPLTMVVKKAMENIESTKSAAVLLGPPPRD